MTNPVGIRKLVLLAACLALVVIVVGAYVRLEGAGLGCPDWPGCYGPWLPPMDLQHAFHRVRELGVTAAGAPLSHEALTAIHWTHRLGALITVLYLGGLAVVLLRAPGLAVHGALLLTLLAAQAALGVANVVASQPLALAVAHNAGAALLLTIVVVLNLTVFQRHET